ncbi:unnamed protein product, partial [Thelazia callipaeda]|uniref:MFS domain-containing protein n=1 Tax=Thelazia callipaeda TaxID=103827 RepID=A0A0N5CS38_THECL
PNRTSNKLPVNAITDESACNKIYRVYRVYRQRWVILAVVALLNNSNTMSWISFAPVSNYVDAFYGSKAANWFSLVYIICTIPVGMFAIWMGSSFGLRLAILIAAWTNGIGGTVRFISSFLPLHLRFPIGIFGQAVAACAYPFIMFLPSKVAASWFGENERALATTIGVMANPLGVLMANILSPQIVQSLADVRVIPEKGESNFQVLIINAVTFVPSILICLVATFCVIRSEPRTPPSRSAAQLHVPFLLGMKQCFTNKAYLLLLIVMGGGIGMFNCLYTVIQQLFCATGHSNSFSGLCAALMIIGGVFGATGSGMFVDRTKLYEETMKVCMSLAVFFGIVFLQLTLHPGLTIYLAVTAFLFGVLGLATYPVGLELASECTFPVSEITSTGLVVLSGQVHSIAYVAIMSLFSRPLQSSYKHIQVCTIGSDADSTSISQDSSISIIFQVMSGIATLLAIVLVVFFKPTCKRMEAEKNTRDISLKANGKEVCEIRQLNDLISTKDESFVPLARQQSSS